METILYITGGIARLALAWLICRACSALEGMQELLSQLEMDFTRPLLLPTRSEPGDAHP